MMRVTIPGSARKLLVQIVVILVCGGRLTVVEPERIRCGGAVGRIHIGLWLRRPADSSPLTDGVLAEAVNLFSKRVFGALGYVPK